MLLEKWKKKALAGRHPDYSMMNVEESFNNFFS